MFDFNIGKRVGVFNNGKKVTNHDIVTTGKITRIHRRISLFKCAYEVEGEDGYKYVGMLDKPGKTKLENLEYKYLFIAEKDVWKFINRYIIYKKTIYLKNEIIKALKHLIKKD